MTTLLATPTGRNKVFRKGILGIWGYENNSMRLDSKLVGYLDKQIKFVYKIFLERIYMDKTLVSRHIYEYYYTLIRATLNIT